MRIYTFHRSWSSAIIPSRLASYGKSLPPSSFILLTFAVFCSPSYFLSINILWEQITLLAFHIKFCRRSTVLYYGRRIAYHKQTIYWFCCFFANSVHFLIPVLSFSFFSCNYFHADVLHLSRAQPCFSAQYQAFHTTLSYLMFNLPLTKSSQQCKTARHCWTPMKRSIVISILRKKQYHRVVTVPIKSLSRPVVPKPGRCSTLGFHL